MDEPETPLHLQDPDLADAAAAASGLLRTLAERWRIRVQAGRLGTHPLAESILLVDRLERASRLLELGLDDTAEEAEARVHASLMRSEERFRYLVDNVKDYAIYMLDVEGHVESWNAGAERIKGYRAEEVLGRHFSLFYPAEDVAAGKPERELQIARTEGRYEEEGWRIRKDGKQFLASIVITALQDASGELRGFAKVTRDVTEKHRAIEALRKSEERLRRMLEERQEAAQRLHQSEQTFRLLVEGVRDYAIFMLDPEGRISSWNAGAQNLKGYRAEEVIGRSFSIFYTEPDRARAHPEDELARAKRDGAYQEEGWRVRKDGSLFWASVLITAIYDEDRKLIGFAKVTRDMSERRAAEESLRRMNEDLQVRVRQQLAARKDVESFSYSVSHDLRAPLRALDGFSRLLLEGASERLTETERDYLQRIRGAAQQMSQLIDSMLGLSRLTSAPIDLQEIDVSAQCRAIAASLAQSDPQREVRWSIAEGMKVTADPRLLSILMENLLRNAWKFTRKVADAHIEVGVGEYQGQRTLYVRDNGVGFSMDQAHRLFVPFQRLHRARDFEGSGIGLATVRRIVERHDGRVWAESTPGQGTTFHFTLEGSDAA